MKLLKTFTSPSQKYLECEYKNKCPTYWFNVQELDMWNRCMSEEIRIYIPIGYMNENT